jgi:hypothetical protein
MTFEPRPSIPPLSDGVVARIERRVFAALDEVDVGEVPARHRSWQWGLAMAPVALVAIFVGVWLLRPSGQSLPSGARIATAGTASHVTVQGAAVDVAPRSAIAIGNEPDGTTVLVLDRGAVTCQVAPRAQRAPFVVQAGSTRVTVVGTRFTVERQGDHAAVSVEHGVVEVGDDGVTQVLRAGESYLPSRELHPPALPIAPRAEPARAEHDRPRAEPRRRLALSPPTRTEVAPPALIEEAPPAPAPAPAPMPAVPTTQERFETALRLEPKDPAAALREYQELARGDDAWAANALFAAGRLQLERGQQPEARALLEAYLARFPGGNNRDDARVLLKRLP